MPENSSEQLDLGVDLSSYAAEAREQLENLRDSFESGLKGKLVELGIYCQKNNIDPRDWLSEGPIDESQQEEIESVLGSVGVVTQLVDILKDSANPLYEGTRAILDAVVERLEDKQATFEAVSEEREQMTDDIVGSGFGAITERLGRTINSKHGWFKVLGVGLVGVVGAYKLLTHPKTAAPSQLVAYAGAVAMAVNYGTEIFGEKGKTALQIAEDYWRRNRDDVGGELGAIIDRYADYPGVGADLMHEAVELGAIPFRRMLYEYERAKRLGKESLDMRAVRRHGSGLGIEESSFDKRNGPGLFDLIDEMADEHGFKDLKKKYTEGLFSDFTFFEVLMGERGDEAFLAEAEREESDREEPTSSSSGDSSLESMTSRTPSSRVEAAPERELSGFESELNSIPGFAALNPQLSPSTETNEQGAPMGSGYIMGIPITYTRYTGENGEVWYQFNDFAQHQDSFPIIELGPNQNNDQLAALTKNLRNHFKLELQNRVQSHPKFSNFPIANIDWQGGRWVANQSIQLDSSLGPSAPFNFGRLEFRLSETADVELYHRNKKVDLDAHATFEGALQQAALATVIWSRLNNSSVLSGFHEEDLTIDRLGPVGQSPRSIYGSLRGTEVRFYWDGTEYRAEMTVSESFVGSRMEAISEGGEFTEIFDELEVFGDDLLNQYGRWAADVFNLRDPEALNDEWRMRVELVRRRTLRAYESELRSIPPNDPEAMTKIKSAYESTVGEAIRDFRDLRARLARAQAEDDERGFKEAMEAFDRFGFSESYQAMDAQFDQLLGRFNYQGANEISNPKQYAVLTWIKDHHSEMTAPFQGRTFNLETGNDYYDYCQYLEDAYAEALWLSLNEQARGGKRNVRELIGHNIEFWIRNSISMEDIEANRDAFDKIKTWEEWKIERGRYPQVKEDFIYRGLPYYRGLPFQVEYQPGNRLIVTFFPDKPADLRIEEELHIDTVTGLPVFDRTTVSPELITSRVEAMGNSKYFKEPFGLLGNMFEEYETIWSSLNVDNDRWESALAFKRDDLLSQYKQGLEAIYNEAKPSTPGGAPRLSPAEQAQRMNALTADFQATMTALYSYARETSEEARDLKERGETISKERFDRWVRELENVGYSDVYANALRAVRSKVGELDVSGLQTGVTGRAAFDVQNRAMKIMARRTRRLDQGGLESWEKDYVKALGDAFRDRLAAIPGTVTLDDLERVDGDLNFPDPEAWKQNNWAGPSVAPSASAPAGSNGATAMPAIASELEPFYANQIESGDHPGPYTSHTLESLDEHYSEQPEVTQKVYSVFRDVWLTKVYDESMQIRPEFDKGKVHNMESLNRQLREMVAGKLVSSPEEEDRILEDFRRALSDNLVGLD